MTDFVLAEAMIRQLHARYADAVWRQDYEAFGDCFVEDARWTVGGRVMNGREEIVTNLKKLMPLCERILMTFRTPILEVGDGVATGRTYVTENNVFVDGRPGASIGIYFERFKDCGDRWRFTWRLFQTQYVGPADITGPLYQNPDYGPPPNMPPLDVVSIDHTGNSKRAWAEN